nr:MAG TPA: hypothetical protein [Caudoviricetes sp.]
MHLFYLPQRYHIAPYLPFYRPVLITIIASYFNRPLKAFCMPARLTSSEG